MDLLILLNYFIFAAKIVYFFKTETDSNLFIFKFDHHL
jgi:hypothetical protein